MLNTHLMLQSSLIYCRYDAEAMEKDPVELEPGKLGCPDCRYPLAPGLTPFYYKGDKLGAFEGIVCDMCGYGLLTEKGYEDTGRAIASCDHAPPLHEAEADVEIKYVTSAHRTSMVTPLAPAGKEHRSTTDRSEILLPLPPISSTKHIRTSFRAT